MACSCSDATGSLLGRGKSPGDIDERSGKASAREGNGLFGRKSDSVRSVSICVEKGNTCRGGGGGGRSVIALMQVGQEEIVVAAIGNLERVRVTRAHRSQRCGYGTPALSQGVDVGKDRVAKSQRWSVLSAR